MTIKLTNMQLNVLALPNAATPSPAKAQESLTCAVAFQVFKNAKLQSCELQEVPVTWTEVGALVRTSPAMVVTQMQDFNATDAGWIKKNVAPYLTQATFKELPPHAALSDEGVKADVMKRLELAFKETFCDDSSDDEAPVAAAVASVGKPADVAIKA